jgi:hypothetical protein
MMPVVAQTVAAFFDRPIANALGIADSITPMRGLGRSAWMQRRSIIACSSGACCGLTSCTPIARSAILSEVNSCSAAMRFSSGGCVEKRLNSDCLAPAGKM